MCIRDRVATPKITRSSVTEAPIKRTTPNGMAKNDPTLSLRTSTQFTAPRLRSAVRMLERLPKRNTNTTAVFGASVSESSGTARSAKPNPVSAWIRLAKVVMPITTSRVDVESAVDVKVYTVA